MAGKTRGAWMGWEEGEGVSIFIHGGRHLIPIPLFNNFFQEKSNSFYLLPDRLVYDNVCGTK